MSPESIGFAAKTPRCSCTTNLRFSPSDNDQIIVYIKASADRTNIVVCVGQSRPVLDAVGLAGGADSDEWGIGPDQPYVVHDLLGDQRYTWRGAANWVRLDPRIARRTSFASNPAVLSGGEPGRRAPGGALVRRQESRHPRRAGCRPRTLGGRPSCLWSTCGMRPDCPRRMLWPNVLDEPAVARAVLGQFRGATVPTAAGGSLVFRPGHLFAEITAETSEPIATMRGEQSNTSIRYGDAVMLKLHSAVAVRAKSRRRGW